MPYAVLTVDQRRSRRTSDLVPELLPRLNDPALGVPLLPFERTVGDEVQGVLTSAEQVTGRIALLLRAGAWSIGLGVGAVAEPLPASTRAASGPAFVLARAAVEAAKTTPHRVAARGADERRTDRLDTVLMLWSVVSGRRTDAGWEVADLLEEGMTYAEAGRRLGISQPAVSQRARAAAVRESARAARLVTDLLTELMEEGG